MLVYAVYYIHSEFHVLQFRVFQSERVMFGCRTFTTFTHKNPLTHILWLSFVLSSFVLSSSFSSSSSNSSLTHTHVPFSLGIIIHGLSAKRRPGALTHQRRRGAAIKETHEAWDLNHPLLNRERIVVGDAGTSCQPTIR